MCILMIVADAAVVVGAGRNRDSTNAEWRITSGGYRHPRFLRALNKGNDQRTGANVENALDHNGIIPWDTKNGFSSAPAHGLQLCQQGGDIVRGVFAVDHNPVEAGTSDNLGGYITAETAPKPNLPFAAC